MELGCLEYKTRSVDCGRERGDGLKIGRRQCDAYLWHRVLYSEMILVI